MAMIQVEDVWKSFGDLTVLKGLSLNVAKGETLVILGRSGVGKSVLLKHIIGILKPDRGTITVDDQCISCMSEKELYCHVKRMGMLFQGAALFDSMPVWQNTSYYLAEHGDPETGKTLSRAERRERAKEALASVGLEGTEDKMPSELSGGMRKRAGLARLIIYRPKLLLYDEPTTGLDPITAMQINQLIRQTQRELEATSIVVTHDIRSALEVGDHLALHHEGKIAYTAPREEFIKTDHPLIRKFLENAQTT